MNRKKSDELKRLKTIQRTRIARLDAIARAQANKRRLGMAASPHLEKLEAEAKADIRKIDSDIRSLNPRFGILAVLSR